MGDSRAAKTSNGRQGYQDSEVDPESFWTEERIELLTQCRKRAYNKVNVKRRQHVSANLGSFLQREWKERQPNGPKLSAKYLLNAYSQYCDANTSKTEVKGSPAGGKDSLTVNQIATTATSVSGRPKRLQKNSDPHKNVQTTPPKRSKSSSGQAASPTSLKRSAATTPSPPAKLVSSETHADKQWSEEMLSNLVECGRTAEDLQSIHVGGGKPPDFAGLLLEEWNRIYPHSTLSARNLKSRLTVYQRTVGSDAKPGPVPLAKRRKLETPTTPTGPSPVRKPKAEKVIETPPVKTSPVKAKVVDVKAPPPVKSPSVIKEEIIESDIKSVEAEGKVSSVVDPETSSVKEENIEQDEETSSIGSSGLGGQQQACPKHWTHMFHDRDKDIECFLTDQLLQIRRKLEDKFPGCDIYSPRKPKGFSTCVLDEWRKFYPQTEESNKTIGYKLAKFDRGPDTDVDEKGVKITPKGRIMWSQIMLNNLQLAKKRAMERVSSHKKDALGPVWKEEWSKMYPDLKVDWRTVCSRYNYHFGAIDEQNSSLNESSNPTDATVDHDTDEASKKIQNGTGSASELTANERVVCQQDDDIEGHNPKVKGFRGAWSPQAKQDLLRTRDKLLATDPDLEPGSSEFNRRLLNEFSVLHPKCMETSRSIFSKLQSFDKVTEKTMAVSTAVTSSASQETAKDITTSSTSQKQQKSKEASVVADVKEEYSTIEGFEDWTLTMIRDFISCMDTARNKCAVLRESNPDSQVKLVPLLLDEWRTLYPNSSESVKTFLDKIKHLKSQKEEIKCHLEKSGLMPKFHAGADSADAAAADEFRPDTPSSAPGNSSAIEPFKWHRSMIKDVLESHSRAKQLKAEQVTENVANGVNGKQSKPSFHALWEQEFRRIHPNSTFTSNNLSVHFWTWRKQQSKKRQQQVQNEQLLNEQPTEQQANVVPSSTLSSPSKEAAAAAAAAAAASTKGIKWTYGMKKQLQEVGHKVDSLLQHTNTPNTLKLEGFSNVLYQEWKKAFIPAYSNVDVNAISCRAVNMMYSRIAREGLGVEDPPPETKIFATWTPKHNRVLIEGITNQVALLKHQGLEVVESTFLPAVIKFWRKKFPKSSITHENLVKRIREGIASNEEFAHLQTLIPQPDDDSEPPGIACAHPFASTRSTPSPKLSKSGKQQRKSLGDEEKRGQKSRDHSSKSTSPAPVIRAPNAKGQLEWDRQSITDLFQSYYNGSFKYQRQQDVDSHPLSHFVHAEFVSMYPFVRLSAPLLMAKYYHWKKQFEEGALDFTLPDFTSALNSVVKTKAESEDTPPPVTGAAVAAAAPAKTKSETTTPSSSSHKKDLVFRTWTQEMIDNMLKTRRMAIARKKRILETNPSDVINITDYWYEEFVKLHPDYKSTKKNLWRKYKWYKSRVSETDVNDQGNSEPAVANESTTSLTPASSAATTPMKREDNKENSCESTQQSADQQPVKLKTIRKDIFHFIKAVLEASKIFLPMKLPEPDNIQQQQQTMISAPYQPQMGAAAAHRPPIPPPPPQLTRRPTIAPAPPLSTTEPVDPSSIKLPGGATLVAVSENAVGSDLSTNTASKEIEKPHVTITIGDKEVANNLEESAQELHIPDVNPGLVGGAAASAAPPTSITAILKTPNQTIPLQIPFPINVPQFPGGVGGPPVLPPPMPTHLPPAGVPPPLTQLGPSPQKQRSVHEMTMLHQRSVAALPYVIPPRLKERFKELHLTDTMFMCLLKIYEEAREDYINTLKKGYLMFFPFLIGARWKEQYPNWPIPGRKLVSVIDTFVEEKRKNRNWLPEYLTKVPCSFTVEEATLKQIMMCYIETKKSVEKCHESKYGPGTPDAAQVYAEMCKRWAKTHPEARLTTKQLISIHRMLDYEVRDDPSPETVCQKVDIWRLLDREVPEAKFDTELEEQQQPPPAIDLGSVKEIEEANYDPTNISMEVVQDWISSTSNLLGVKHFQSNRRRPRYVVRNPRLYWSESRVRDLMRARRTAMTKFKRRRGDHGFGTHQIDLLRQSFVACHPGSKITKHQLMSKCKQILTQRKRSRKAMINKQLKKWETEASNYLATEESVAVMPFVEEAVKSEAADVEDGDTASVTSRDVGGFTGRLTSLNNGSYGCLKHDAGERNFNRDDDVIAYIAETQANAKSASNTTWTADVIADLVRARAEARRRKREWEAWATKKYGGVGVAYNNPSIQYEKVDEMFKQEWAKLRPQLANLSIWTLVSYARKYDTLKKQLLSDNGQKYDPDIQAAETRLSRRTSAEADEPAVTAPAPKPTFQRVFFPNSSVPKFDLDALDKVFTVPQEYKDLLRTRQLAKLRDSPKRLVLVWAEEWAKAGHAPLPGHALMRRLYVLDRVHWKRVAKAVEKSTDDGIGDDIEVIDDDEEMRVKPRFSVFPEDEVCPPEGGDNAGGGGSGTGFTLKLWTEVRTSAPIHQDFLSCPSSGSPHASGGGGGASGGSVESETSEKLLTFDRDPRAKMDVATVPVLHLAARDSSNYTTLRSRAKCYDFFKRPGPQTGSKTAAVPQASGRTNSNDAFFVCNQCDHMYQNANDLQYHLTLHSF